MKSGWLMAMGPPQQERERERERAEAATFTVQQVKR